MRTYSLGLRTAITAATANTSAAVLWNPSTSKRLWVTQIGWAKTAAVADNLVVTRATGRGTQTTTLAAATANDFDNDSAPGTTATVDSVWSAQPTLAATPNFKWPLAAAIGAGFIWNVPAGGFEVPPGTGLAIATPVAIALQAADITFVWNE